MIHDICIYILLIVFHMVCKKKHAHVYSYTCTHTWSYWTVVLRGGASFLITRGIEIAFLVLPVELWKTLGLESCLTWILWIKDSWFQALIFDCDSQQSVSVLLKWHFLLLWWFSMVSHVYCFQSSIMEPPLIDPTGTRLRMMAVKRENGVCRQQLHWTYLWWKWRKWWKWWNMDQLFFSFVDFVAAAAVVAVAGAKKPCSFDRYSRTWTRNLSIVVNFTQHQNCNRLVTIMFSCSGSNWTERTADVEPKLLCIFHPQECLASAKFFLFKHVFCSFSSLPNSLNHQRVPKCGNVHVTSLLFSSALLVFDLRHAVLWLRLEIQLLSSTHPWNWKHLPTF